MNHLCLTARFYAGLRVGSSSWVIACTALALGCQSRTVLLEPMRCDTCGVSSDATRPPGDAASPESSLSPLDAGWETERTSTFGTDAPDSGGAPAPFTFDIPPGFPQPPVPADNPMSAAKVELGRHLFYDTRLSANETMSCASCHRQELAFTDGLAVSIGSTGENTPRGSMMLANVAYSSSFTWANPLLLTLERQALVPMFGTTPIELGLTSNDVFESKLRAVPTYQRLFADAYPDEAEPITVEHVVQALASFQRTLISGNSPFDRYLYRKDAEALSPEAIRGYELFSSEELECFHCHAGFNLSDHVTWEGKPFIDRLYHNTGLYNIDGKGAYPEPNTGVMSVTGDPADMGRFRAPSLRNIAVTAPYMHDGSMATLSEVLDHYAAGGRTIASGPYAGDGSKSPLRSSMMIGFTLSERDRADVLAFLDALTDETFLTDPRFSNPWPESNER
jgi:cytochrome c peroxidase